jgi:transcriptional regulator with XRE-family HTH domain
VNTSYRVVELVRSKISSAYVTASDTDVSRVLGVSRAIISAYKHGRNVMSGEMLTKAQDLLQLPDAELFDLMLSLQAEGEPEPELQKHWRDLHRFIRSSLKNGARLSAWIVTAILAAGTIPASPVNQASNADFQRAQSIHYAYSRRRRLAHSFPEIPPIISDLLKAWKRFLMVFPVLAVSACGALHTREEQTWQALNAIDTAQTLNIVGDPCYVEGNAVTRALVGAHPQTQDVLLSMAGYAVAHAAVTELLLRTEHPGAARLWNYVTIGEKAFNVGHNFYIGVRIGGANKTPSGCTR